MTREDNQPEQALGSYQHRFTGDDVHRANIFAILNEIGRELTSTLDLDHLFRAIFEQTSRLLEVDSFLISLYDPQTAMVRHELLLEHGKRYSTQRSPLGSGLLAHVIRTQRPLLIGSVAEQRKLLGYFGSESSDVAERSESILFVPLLARGSIIGAISVQSERPHAYDSFALEVLTVIAAEAAIAIENARLYEAQRRVIRQLKALQDGMTELNRNLDHGATLHFIVKEAARVFDAERAAVFLRQPEVGGMVCAASYGLSAEYLAAIREQFEFAPGRTAQVERHPVYVANATTDPRFEALRPIVLKEGYRSILSLPLIHGRESMGILSLYHDRVRPYPLEEIELAQAFADQATIALSNAETYQSVVLARQYLEAVVNAMGEGLVVYDRETCIRLATPVVYDFFGLDRRRHNLVGMSISEFVEMVQNRFAKPDEARKIFESLLTDPQAYERAVMEIAQPHRRFLQRLVSPMQDEHGELMGQVVVLHDVTAEIEAQRVQGEFLSMLSHELRTPLTSIKGYAQILLRRLRHGQEVDDKGLEIINEQSDHMISLVDDLLDIAQIDKGRFPIRRATIDPVALVRDVADRLQPMHPAHEIVLVAPPVSVTVRGDQFRLHELVTNLISNAIKYSPDGGQIDVRFYAALPRSEATGDGQDAGPWPTSVGLVPVAWNADPDFVVVSVADQGIGIAPDQFERIFERFYQVDRSSTRRFGGVGLGLYISKDIVEGHDGRIWVQSRPGKGSVFSFSLPIDSVKLVE